MDLLEKTKNPETGNVFNDLQIAKGAIVSKILLKSAGGNTSIFAIDKDQQISEHAAPFDVVVYCFEGIIDFLISGEIFKLTKGQWLTVPANASHGLICIEPAKIMITMFKSEMKNV